MQQISPIKQVISNPSNDIRKTTVTLDQSQI
jgi:hypothetical protein